MFSKYILCSVYFKIQKSSCLKRLSQDGDRGLLVAAPAPLNADAADAAEAPAVKAVASSGPSWEELKVGDRIHPDAILRRREREGEICM